MPGNFDSIPGAQIGKDLLAGFLELFFNERDFLLETNPKRIGAGVLFQLSSLACNSIIGSRSRGDVSSKEKANP